MQRSFVLRLPIVRQTGRKSRQLDWSSRFVVVIVLTIMFPAPGHKSEDGTY